MPERSLTSGGVTSTTSGRTVHWAMCHLKSTQNEQPDMMIFPHCRCTESREKVTAEKQRNGVEWLHVHVTRLPAVSTVDQEKYCAQKPGKTNDGAPC